MDRCTARYCWYRPTILTVRPSIGMKSVKFRTMSSRCAGRSIPATRISWLDSSSERLAQLGCDVLARDRLRLLPLGEVLALRRERPDHRLVEVRGDHELVGVEEALVALVVVDARSLVRVALQLVDRFDGRVGDVRALALDDDERDAVDEEHDVGNDELVRLTAGLVNAELVDRQELVALGMLPVDVVDRLAAPAVPALDAVHRRTGEEKGRDLLVGLDQLERWRSQQRRLRLSDAALVQPLVAVIVNVDPAQRCPQMAATGRPRGTSPDPRQRVPLRPFDVRPAPSRQAD